MRRRLNQTWLTQPALFAIEYALAQWWISLGVEPAAMAGHSIGEYVAACLAGVFSLEDALAIVAARGRLIYDLPAGSMLAVPLAAAEIHVNGAISLAAINNPAMCVVSGPTPAIAAYEESLAKQSIACRRLFTSHAFHSAMMDPILGRIRGAAARRRFQRSAHSLSLECHRHVDQAGRGHGPGLLGAPHPLDGSFQRQSRRAVPLARARPH